MKVLFIGVFAMFIYTHAANAQHKTAAPKAVQEAFVKAYPDVQKVKWEKENQSYEASFIANNHKMSLLYAGDGKLLETETAIPVSELPAAAKKYAQAKGSITEAARIVKADGSTLYEAEVHHTDLLFDEKGNFIKEHKD